LLAYESTVLLLVFLHRLVGAETLVGSIEYNSCCQCHPTFCHWHTLLFLLLGLLLPWLKTLLLLTEAYLQHIQHNRLVLKSCRKYSVVYHFAWTWMTCTVYNCIPMSDGWQMTEVSRVYLVNASCDHGLNNPECVYMHDRCHRVLILDTSACDLQRCADAIEFPL